MNFVEKYRTQIILLVLISALYFLLRLPNLTLQPIFADEAIYIRWAQVMKSEPTLRFLPLSDGKTPLFMWVMIPLFKVFSDPLFTGRFLSVLSGSVTLLGVFFLGSKVFNKQVGLFAALIYTVTPYTVFFDRMALVDSMLSAFIIWSLYFVIWLLRFQRLDLAMILGYLLGGGLLVKTPAMLNILTLPVTLIGFNFKNSKRHTLIKLLGFWLVSIIIALMIYNVLRLGPNFNQLSSRNQDYIFSPVEIVNRPLDPFIPHFRDIADWFPKLLTWPILIVGLLGIIRVMWEKNRLGMVILAWAAVPLLIQMVLLKTFTARYLLSSIPPLLILAAYGVDQLTDKVVKVIKIPNGQRPLILMIFLLLVILLALRFDYSLLTNPQDAPLPQAERKGYLEEWTAGYGFKEIANFLIEKSKEGPVVVGTEGYFGTLPDGLYIYLDKANIAVVGSGASVSAKIRDATNTNKVYFVANKKRIQDLTSLKLLQEFPKAMPIKGEQDAIQLFQVLPK